MVWSALHAHSAWRKLYYSELDLTNVYPDGKRKAFAAR